MLSKRALALAAAVLAAGPAAADTDLSWVGRLAGLSLQTSKTTSAEGFKAIYTMSGGADATLDSVRAGLAERGWTIRKAADVPAGSVEVRTLTADKDGARVTIAVTDVMGAGTLTVSLRGGAAGGSPSATPSEGTVGAIVRGALEGEETASTGAVVSAGASLVVAGNAVTQTHDCGARDVSVTASRSGITLRGTCRTVKVAGNSNTVTIDATVQAIHAVGRANTVTWSAKKNPRAPEVKHLGSQNRVHSDAER
jgi:Protein of unknown function (DUF3060)